MDQQQKVELLLSKVQKRTIDGKPEIKCSKCGFYCCDYPKVVDEEGKFFVVTDDMIQNSMTSPSINLSNTSNYTALYFQPNNINQNIILKNPAQNKQINTSPKKSRSKISSIKRKRIGGNSARIDDLRITRGVSNYLQEVNTTRHRYELSGASPLKWIKNMEEFDRPLTKEASLRYKQEIMSH